MGVMGKYRKKPIEIDAVQMPHASGDFSNAPEWLRDVMQKGTVSYLDDDTFRVSTLEGQMTGTVGDYIIKGIAGEIYPVQRDIFHRTYERVT